MSRGEFGDMFFYFYSKSSSCAFRELKTIDELFGDMKEPSSPLLHIYSTFICIMRVICFYLHHIFCFFRIFPRSSIVNFQMNIKILIFPLPCLNKTGIYISRRTSMFDSIVYEFICYEYESSFPRSKYIISIEN